MHATTQKPYFEVPSCMIKNPSSRVPCHQAPTHPPKSSSPDNNHLEEAIPNPDSDASTANEEESNAMNDNQDAHDCAAMTHGYNYLTHAALGLGASHLSQNGNVNYNAQALQHRVTAINLINQQLADTSHKSIADRDALFAALMCIAAQSCLMPHGMTEYLVMSRGATLVSTAMMPEYHRSVFRTWTPDAHIDNIRDIITDQPKDMKMIEGFKSSALALETRCRTECEKIYCESMLKAISWLPTSSVEAWKEFVTLFMIPSYLGTETFQSFVDPSNHVGQLLIIHMFLLDYIIGRSVLALSDEPKCPGRKNMVISWTEEVVDRLPEEYKEHGIWLKEFCRVLARQDARYLLSP
ncbi:hypothetical protein CDV31_007419 [Fusarium ambrosium]|uniref:Transcription factor domain-containing protein n=1 Tax=Fusarium ambrosium TaxID=131363 RepID=A0A428U6Q0_9HYPO|nr:hypothetical protein CDV31_007419 [Fusarium ambrosium]